MSGPIATGAGFTGELETPRDPTRLPIPYKSTAAAPKRKGRGKAKLLDVTRKMATEGRLNVELDDTSQMWKAIGDMAHAKYYKDLKNDLHNYFKDLGGDDNEEYVRAHPSEAFRNKQYWGCCCDRFMSDKFKSNTQTQQLQLMIYTWGDMHRFGPNWDNTKLSKRLYGDKATQMSLSAFGSSSSSVHEDVILQRVLGTYRGHMMRVGPTLLWRTVSSASSSSGSQLKCSSSAQLPPEYQS
ncbi:hypothetical protein TIFTF001_035457 [Ficus carica]|uniref:Uncharacterized protein n=1 Tax=Ficus carica TaxID=3494 RepID=A0AA88JBR3_FICCA|nr:hypothetical protein TIFTF001_035457 [Ficus carica]